MKVTLLLSHTPNPRMHRRMVALRDEHSVTVVFWDRCLDIRTPYSIPEGVETHSVVLPAPEGKWIRRIIPLFRFKRESIKLLRDIEPDAIHCGNLDMLFVAYSYKVLVDPDVKLVYEVADLREVMYNTNHDLKSSVLTRVFSTMERLLCKKIDLLVITSPYFWADYYSAFVPREKVLFLPNAPERRLFADYEKKPQNGFIIGFIGLIRYPEQIRMLIDATEDIGKVKVLLAGSGASYEEIRGYCAEKEHVLFYGPYNYQEDIVFLYSQIDCVYSVYNTTYKNVRVALPNRLYEAIACELPIIVADNTALARFVVEHGIGFAVADRDVITLRNLIVRLITHPELLDETRRRLREVKPLYSAEAGYDELLQSYRGLGAP